MKLIASLIVKNEIGRYLRPCIEHLLEFCDEVAIVEDGTDAETTDWLLSRKEPRLWITMGQQAFFAHEGRARQDLLGWTLAAQPTHVLAIDADEFISDGAAIRHACEQGHDAYGLTMMECWDATEDGLCVRVDGGWKPTRVPALWRVPNRTDELRIADRALACGRVPTTVDHRSAYPVDVDIVHFGWANEGERVARHHRYAVADGGRFHRSAHLDSILWGCDRVALERMDWPAALVPFRGAILAKVTSTESPVNA